MGLFDTGSIFIDLARLRIGTYIKHDTTGGTLTVWYKPFTGHPFPKTVQISGIPDPNSLIIRQRMYDQPGTFPAYHILLTDETGKSPFLGDDLQNKLPKIMKLIDDMRKSQEIKQAAVDSMLAIVNSGRKEVLTGIAQEKKIIDEGSKNDQARRREELLRRPEEEF